MTLKDFIPPVFSNLFQVKKDGDGKFFYVFNSSYDPWKEAKYLESYNCIPELNAVINMKANARSNGRFKVVDDNGKEYPDEPILKLLNKPNWFQAGKEFIKQTTTFHEIFGNEYLYGFLPVGMDWSRASALYTLPPNLVDSEYNDKLSFFSFRADETPSVKYIIKSDGKEQSIDPNLIIHLNDNRADIRSVKGKRILKGDSKLRALRPSLNNIKMAYESRGVILESRGANGALTPDYQKDATGQSMPMSEPELERIHGKFKDNYGTLRGQRQLIISPQALKWVQMGTNNPQNLGLYQETEEDFKKIQDAYGTPPEMFASKTGATFENQKMAERGMYVRTIIPEANEWVTGLNARVYPDGKKKLIVDFSHLEIFQEDLKVKADAMSAVINNLSKLLQDKQITQEEYRTELAKIGVGDGKPIPVVTGDDQEIETRQAQATLRGSVGGVQGILAIQAAVSAGTTSRNSALGILTIVFGFTDQQANEILA